MVNYRHPGPRRVWDGGSALTLLPPFPEDPADPADPVDPLDPVMNSKNAVFIVRVVIFGLDGAPA